MLLLAIFVTCVGALQVDPHPPNTPQDDLTLLQELYTTVSVIQDGIYSFWINYGQDDELGGFYTTVDTNGDPVLDIEQSKLKYAVERIANRYFGREVPQQDSPANKNTIMQTRHLYCTSKLYLTGRHPTSDTGRIIDLMNSQYEWIIEHFLTYLDEPVYEVTRDGKTVVNGEVQMYYTDFFIYGMSYFAMAIKDINGTRSSEAIDFALKAYDSLHKRLYDDTYGGYDQSKEGNFFVSYGETARGQDWSMGSKGFNAHMHLLEALTALYQASQSHYIYDRLQELLGHYMDDVLQGYNFHPLVMYRNWTALSDVDNTYGHDIETCHLIQDAGETVGCTAACKEDLDAKAVEIASQVQFYGYDRTNGGLFYGGVIGLGPFQYWKEFWEQAEATLGFWRAYYVSGNSSYLHTIQGILHFYNEFMLVEEVGEFYNDFYYNCVDCSVNPNLYNLWKAPYHNMRNFLTFLDEVEIFLQSS